MIYWETNVQHLIQLIDQAQTQDELDKLEEQFIQILPNDDRTQEKEMALLHTFHEAKMVKEDTLQEDVTPASKKATIEHIPNLEPPAPFVIPVQAKIFNHIYGQFDIANVTDEHRYNTACAAMASTAVVLLGSLMKNIDTLTEAQKAQLMQDILSAGAAAYDATSDKSASNFTLADAVLPFLMSQQQNLNFRINDDLTITYVNCIHALTENSSKTSDLPFQTLLEIIQQNTESHDDHRATGVVLSDGMRSNAVLYIRGDRPENGWFVLYDSHRRSQLVAQSPSPAEAPKTIGSFLAYAPDIDTIVSIARADRRWPVAIAGTGTYTDLGSLQSPVFIDVLQPQPSSAQV
jgi:hypothetical protein